MAHWLGEQLEKECCGTDNGSVVPDWRALHLNWNGRSQFTGVVRRGDVCRLLDDPSGELDGPGHTLTTKEVSAHVFAAVMRNIDRVPEEGPLCVDDMHFDMRVPANSARFRLHPSERGEGCTERGLDGVLDVEVRVGDRVKIVLDPAEVMEQMGAPAEMVAHFRTGQMGSERYWAHVLGLKGQLLIVLPEASLNFLPSEIASEPYAVNVCNVYGVVDRQRLA